MPTHLFPSVNATGDPINISDIRSYRKNVSRKVNTLRQVSPFTTGNGSVNNENVIQTIRPATPRVRIYFTSTAGNPSQYWSFATEALADAEILLIEAILEA